MMSLIHVFLFLILGTLESLAMCRTILESTIVDKHEQWMVDFSRKYESQLEKEKRLNIFKDNLEYIESLNNGGNRSFKLGPNEFADMTQNEFIATHTGYKMPNNSTLFESTSLFYFAGCCWAFSAVATVEGLIKINTSKLIPLSEQQLLDCSRNGGNQGCKGGWMMNAFDYISQNQGITSEESYPYKEMQETCDTQINEVATIKALLKAVVNQPVSVALDGYERDFHLYSGGVFTGDCGNSLNHAVTIVGYGTSEEGLNYWLIKNSWGQRWGENGYMKIQRNVERQGGLCGIAMKASYPTA
ncbi:hypothetical protein V6Z11_D05G372500 [Gossypium hirsutum]